MAVGKPLIGTKVGGIPSQVKEGWNGFLIDPGNEIQLAERIMYLLSHTAERKRMGQNSLQLANEEYDWQKISEKYLKIYENIRYTN